MSGLALKRCSVSDLMGKLTQRTLTAEGYLVAPGNLSKAGNVQEYSAGELGLDIGDVNPSKRIRMYRPADEVFAPDALASFEGKPITLSHPPANVTADNYREYNVGHVSDIAGGNSYMTGTLHIRDRAAVDAVLDDTRQLSCGYSFEPDMTSGTLSDGTAYDGIMRKIRGNHQAIVDMARGGPGCRIADHQRINTGDTKMAIKKTLDGITLEFVDEAQASMVEKLLADARAAMKTATDASTVATKRATDAEAALATEKTASAKLVTDHTAEVAALKAQIPTAEQKAALDTVAKTASDHAAEITRLKALVPTAEKIEKLAVDYHQVVSDAVSVIPTFDAKGKSAPAIRTEVLATVIAANDGLKRVVDKALAGVEPAKASEDVVRIAFDSVVAAKSLMAPADATGSVNDPAVARALAGDASAARGNGGGNGGRKVISGYDLLRLRERNGGKDPNKATA